jgi:hypothetical protein
VAGGYLHVDIMTKYVGFFATRIQDVVALRQITRFDQRRDELMMAIYHHIHSVTSGSMMVSAITVIDDQSLSQEFGPITQEMLKNERREKELGRLVRLGLAVSLDLGRRLNALCFVSPLEDLDEGQLPPLEEALELTAKRLNT